MLTDVHEVDRKGVPLDQVNKNFHLEYKTTKDQLFTQMTTISREGLMVILAKYVAQNDSSVDSLTKAVVIYFYTKKYIHHLN